MVSKVAELIGSLQLLRTANDEKIIAEYAFEQLRRMTETIVQKKMLRQVVEA